MDQISKTDMDSLSKDVSKREREKYLNIKRNIPESWQTKYHIPIQFWIHGDDDPEGVLGTRELRECIMENDESENEYAMKPVDDEDKPIPPQNRHYGNDPRKPYQSKRNRSPRGSAEVPNRDRMCHHHPMTKHPMIPMTQMILLSAGNN